MANLNTKMIALVLAAGLASGCGGGGSSSGGGYIPPVDGGDAGGSDDEVVEQPIDYGKLNWSVLLDGTVIGLSYSTGDIKKSVIENGFAEFYDEDTVRIYLGDALITEDTGRKVLSPTDIQNGAGASNPDFLANLAEVLAAADEDGRIDNGIIIGEEARAVVKGDINFDVPYSQFIADNAELLAALRTASGNSSSGLLGKNVAENWMQGLEKASNSAFKDFEGNYKVFTGTGQFYGDIRLNFGGNGVVRQYGSQSPNAGGSASISDIEQWSTDVTGSKMTYNAGIERTCYALSHKKALTTAVCIDEIGQTPSFWHFMTDMRLYTTEEHVTPEMLAGDYSRYSKLGSIMSYFGNEPAENVYNTGVTLNADGTAVYGGRAGTWSTVVTLGTEIHIDHGDGVTVLVPSEQYGPYALGYSVPSADGSGMDNDGVQVLVDSAAVLSMDVLSGKSYQRLSYSGGADFGEISFALNSNATNSPSVSYRINDATGQLHLDGAEMDKCSFLGNVASSLIFACNNTQDDTVGSRIEWWVRNSPTVI